MIEDFTICLNTKFVFGRDSEQRVGEEFAALGVRRVFIHHDDGPYLLESGLLDVIRSSLAHASIDYVELGGVKPNPSLDLVRMGIDIVRQRHVDAVLAIGGGSVIDSAKAIALGSAMDKNVWDCFTGTSPLEDALPIGVVLTCPASGSESSQVAVISDDVTHRKLTLSHPILRPTLAFLNPALSASLPSWPTACGIVDMYSHLCERYFSADPEIGVTDRMIEGALKTLLEQGPKCLADLSDYDARAQLMWIGTLAQSNILGVGRSQDWSTHLIGNEISALYDTPHGATLSIIMPAWMRVSARRNPWRFALYARELFHVSDLLHEHEQIREGIVQTIRFFRNLHMPVSFADLNLSEPDIDRMVGNIPFHGPDHAIGSVARITADDCRMIYGFAIRDTQTNVPLSGGER